ncbi:MAG: L-histidine N(alpha)-methyltransferase [Candidatus Aminicenantes bacterium]|nr:L-histidine N(alpha)-methyltransferase [Candidatus Aminicenantes bacterium]
MTATYFVLTHKYLHPQGQQEQDFSTDVLIGLSQMPKKLSSKYFYDERGSQLFQEIMELSEYYLTSCEFEILSEHKEKIALEMAGEAFNLIEFGSGDGRKTNILLDHFQEHGFEFQYHPIDISEKAMSALIERMNREFPGLSTEGIVAEYFEGLKWLNNTVSKRNLILFLGSNLGNFDKAHSRAFLHNLWNVLNNGDVLVIGFDLKKDIEVMLKAYNDSKGVTAEFNLNLLRRINLELGGNFDLERFRFYAGYDVFSGAIESYLVSLGKQEVYIEKIGQSFLFDSWEPIHTEYSYKYLESDIEELAERTGFLIKKQLYDSKRCFVDSVWIVNKQSRHKQTG